MRTATSLLIVGLLYTVLHKAVHALAPALVASPVGATVTSTLWLAAAATLVLFAYESLRELSPRDPALRFALVAIAVFTGLIIAAKLPFWSKSGARSVARLIFTGARFLNSIAVLVCALSFERIVKPGTPLRTPLTAVVWASGLTVVLGIVSLGYYAAFLVTGREVEPPPILRLLAVVSFLYVYGAAVWFLIVFRRLDHTEFTNR
jgi:hypothetical protein